jgi:cyclic dehypoxanthinyl futalosine synthase
MNTLNLLEKAIHHEFLSHQEGMELLQHASTAQLMWAAHQLRLA